MRIFTNKKYILAQVNVGKKKIYLRKIISILLCIAVINIFFQTVKPNIVFAAINDSTVEVLGGGGGGGFISGAAGGGGGGGGEYHRCTEILSVQSYTVTVGVGGTADNTGETDSIFSGTGISMTADGGNGTANGSAGSAGTGGTVTGCDTGPITFAGGTPGAGSNTNDVGGGGGGGAGYGGKGGNSSDANSTAGEGGGGGAGESGAGGDTTTAAAGAAGAGGGGAGGIGVTTTYAATSNGSAGVPATYHIVGGGGGGGGDDGTRGGACGAPGAGSGGGDITGAGNGCRGEVRIIYVDAEIDATGGTETTSGIYRIHTFTTSGTFTVNTISTTPPTVSTDAASSVTSASATLNGQITATGGNNATVRGFAWGTSSTLTGTDTSTTTDDTGSFGISSFTNNVSGLIAGRIYYFRAYATNSGGTGFDDSSPILSFTASNADTTISRKLRLFEGFILKLITGRIILFGN